MVYHTIYYHVALQSTSTFKQLVKIIPDLYRWFKDAKNRAIIVKHFIYKIVRHNYKTHVLITKTLFDRKLHSIDNAPAYVFIILTENENERLNNLSKLEINNIDYIKFDVQLEITYKWFTNNILTRDNGAPAVVGYGVHGDEGFCIWNEWIINNKRHRDIENPAIIHKYLTSIDVWEGLEQYYTNNRWRGLSGNPYSDKNQLKEEINNGYLFIYNENILKKYMLKYGVSIL